MPWPSPRELHAALLENDWDYSAVLEVVDTLRYTISLVGGQVRGPRLGLGLGR